MRERRVTSFILPLAVLAGSASACTLGDTGEGVCDANGTICRVSSGDADVEQRLDDLEIVCETTFVLSGTFVESREQPVDLNGCWEVGTWTVNWDVDRQGCTPAPALPDTLVYVADRSGDPDIGDDIYSGFTFPADDNPDRQHMKVTTAGDGLCHANLEHYGWDSNNNILVNMQPTLQDDGTITGIGTWSLYREDPIWF